MDLAKGVGGVSIRVLPELVSDITLVKTKPGAEGAPLYKNFDADLYRYLAHSRMWARKLSILLSLDFAGAEEMIRKAG